MKLQIFGNIYTDPKNLTWEDHKAITVNFVIQVLYNISLGLDPYRNLKLPIESQSFCKKYWPTIERELRKFLYQHCCEKDKAILTYQAEFISHIVGASTLVLSELITDMDICELLHREGINDNYSKFALACYDSICEAVDITKKKWDEIHNEIQFIKKVENSTKVEL